ncbi:hypothetical protein CES85_0925 [Ochrobactrum quorumnocens]|uniref:Uncharacterized protein n=1 Tax=Ochrobactrum quorumnocens TaxID=271865 RepID=A0A248ULA1_9HYPH|nr:hypothetical protein CES85_0925 [[Ochrobactrum] quorumnocens]
MIFHGMADAKAVKDNHCVEYCDFSQFSALRSKTEHAHLILASVSGLKIRGSSF